MALGWAIGLIVLLGMAGGLINAFLREEGLTLPKLDTLSNGQRICRPGFAGNVIIGGVTAVILAGPYSPLGTVELVGSTMPTVHVTLGSCAGALLSGIGGARILTQDVDKRYSAAASNDAASVVQKLASGS
jgi:hypothetical protein